MSAFEWELGQQNLVTYVMIDGSGVELAGALGSMALEVSKAGGALVAGGGALAEIGSGWYSYLSTAAEADTAGPISITVTATGAQQQNLEYVVKQRNVNGSEFTYTVTDNVTSDPIQGVLVTVTTDIAGVKGVFAGITDSFGVLRHSITSELPFLDPGPYYFWSRKPGYSFTNPDLETVV